MESKRRFGDRKDGRLIQETYANKVYSAVVAGQMPRRPAAAIGKGRKSHAIFADLQRRHPAHPVIARPPDEASDIARGPADTRAGASLKREATGQDQRAESTEAHWPGRSAIV